MKKVYRPMGNFDLTLYASHVQSDAWNLSLQSSIVRLLSSKGSRHDTSMPLYIHLWVIYVGGKTLLREAAKVPPLVVERVSDLIYQKSLEDHY